MYVTPTLWWPPLKIVGTISDSLVTNPTPTREVENLDDDTGKVNGTWQLGAIPKHVSGLKSYHVLNRGCQVLIMLTVSNKRQ